MVNFIHIFCDGAFRSKYNIGAWAYTLQYIDNYFETGNVIINDPVKKNVTSQKMEIYAAIYSLKKLKTKIIPIILTTDSQYVEQGINEWSKYWVNHDWRNKQGNKIKNLEL